MRPSIFIIIITVLVSTACGNNPPTDASQRKDGFSQVQGTKEDSLEHDVMEGHDVGMANIGKIRKYQGQVQHLLDSVNKLPPAKLDKQYQQTLTSIQEELKYADYSMNTWMEEYSMDSAKDNEELRIRYLEAEKAKVGKVKEHILNSLKRADSLFNKQ